MKTTKLFLAILGVAFAMNVFSQESEQKFKKLNFTRHNNLITDTKRDRDSIVAYVRYYYNEKDNHYFYVKDVYEDEKSYRIGYSTLEPSIGITGLFKQYFVDKNGEITVSVGEYDANTRIGEWTDFAGDSILVGKCFFDNEGKKTGHWQTWYESGQSKDDEHFVDGNPHGKCLYYFDNGQLAAEELYKNGELIDYKLFDEAGNQVIRENYEPMEMPAYKGGNEKMMNFLSQNIIYPQEALKQGIQGTVVVYFIVKPNGELTDMKVIKSVHLDLDNEALRVVKLMDGKWNAGMLHNQKVYVSFSLPVKFKLRK